MNKHFCILAFRDQSSKNISGIYIDILFKKMDITGSNHVMKLTSTNTSKHI